MLYLADQVSLYSGCFHHRPQIVMATRLLDEGKQAWTSISGNNDHVPWETLVLRINTHFIEISHSTRSLTDQDLECLRRIASCQDFVSLENFERMWYWLYPVAFNLSKKVLTVMWIQCPHCGLKNSFQRKMQNLRFIAKVFKILEHLFCGSLHQEACLIQMLAIFFLGRNAATAKYATSRACAVTIGKGRYEEFIRYLRFNP